VRISVLDHGYVEFIEACGHGLGGTDDTVDYDGIHHAVRLDDFEVGIIEAARQSTQGSFRGWDEDSKLLTYLYRNKHLTPFEQAGMTIEVQAPIFVFREWHRHRTSSYNEMSARYAPLPDLYYNPDDALVLQRAEEAAKTVNRQAAGVSVWDEDKIREWLADQAHLYGLQETHYQHGLKIGVPKEIARIGMPVGHYSRMRASANLRNWLQFLTLRLAPAAQYEIREYAKVVGQIVAETFPHTWELFNEFSV
jgi:thymidylate synthase (FAD)